MSLLRPVPIDFIQVAPTMTRRDLRTHYKAGVAAVERWIRETGVQPKPPMPHSERKRPERRNVYSMIPTAARGRQIATIRTVSVHDLAADELRRQRFAVHRCDERGLYAEKGQFWRVGTVVVDGDELLARADRYRRAA